MTISSVPWLRHRWLRHCMEPSNVKLELLRLRDERHRRLATKTWNLELPRLKEIVGLVTPRALLDRHQRFIAGKYDGCGKRSASRPPRRERFAT
jgi:hypothetical protein